MVEVLKNIFNLFSIENYQKIFSFFFPQTCILCGVEDTLLCEKCESSLERVEKQYCHVCKKEIINLDKLVHDHCKKKTNLNGVIVLYKYDKRIEKIIADIKYELHYKSVNIFRSAIKQVFQSRIVDKFTKENTILVPVPLHWMKYNYRGFNQGELICEIIKEENGFNYLNLLKRIKYTSSQIKFLKTKRVKNLQNAFQINKSQILKIEKRIKNIIIVDDVMTTGTTLEECAKILKENFTNCKIYGLVIARG